MGTVYLIHFDEPFHHARHYLGFCEDGNLAARYERHQAGRGSKLLRAVAAAGIGFEVVRTWEGVDRNFERALKNQRNAPRLCPRCREGRHGPAIGACGAPRARDVSGHADRAGDAHA